MPYNGAASDTEFLYNATIEADADGDGYGDETQDQCWTDPSTQAPCPAPTISGDTTAGQALTATPNGSPQGPAYQWLRCDSGGGACAPIPGATTTSYTLVSDDVDHTLRFRKTATNSGGSQTTDSAQTAVVSAAPTPPPGPLPPVVTKPVISSVKVTPSTWQLGSQLPSFTRLAPVGTTISFNLSRPAQATLAFSLAKPGRKVGRRCVAPSRMNASKPRCTRYVSAGSLSFAARAGLNKVRFQGRLSRRKFLKPGRYLLTITAVDATRIRSAPRTANFTVLPQ